ncbi:MAG: TetR/AcrR family transcriptional regulator [Burkholderiales bacterium]|jgi:AcrR family transcriptional regulator|nr:TetR/AcrR family transcriptional regulator [Burkholderiales bacterium]
MLQPVSAKLRAPRADNRLPRILDEAARLFRAKGYQGASVRDISRSVDMLPGSLYYHFSNKDDLLVAVYAEGVRRITQAVREAVAAKTDPWERLEAACVAHLEALLDPGDYGQVVIRVRPADAPGAADRLVALRGGYEKLFRDLVAALPLPAGADRKTLRLMLLGALNWTQTWYRPGRLNPRRIARQYVALLRQQLGAG